MGVLDENSTKYNHYVNSTSVLVAGSKVPLAASTSCTTSDNFLLPDLDTSMSPPAAIAELVKEGNFGLKSGKGVYFWNNRDGKAPLAARADKLFQHMKDSFTRRPVSRSFITMTS